MSSGGRNQFILNTALTASLLLAASSHLFAADAPATLSITIDPTPLDISNAASVKFSSSGEYLLNPDNRNVINWKTGKSLLLLAASALGPIEISPDAKVIAVSTASRRDLVHVIDVGYGISLLDAATGKPLVTVDIFANYIHTLAFTADSKRLFAFSYENLYELEIPSGKLLQDNKRFIDPRDFALAPDGRTYAVKRVVYPEAKNAVDISLPVENEMKWSSVSVQISLYSMDTRQLLKSFDPVPARVQSFAFTPDGKYLVTDVSPVPLVYDMSTQKRVPLNSSESYPRPFLPIRARYLVGYNPHTDANLSWDLQTGKIVPLQIPDKPKPGSHTISAVAPDAEHVVIAESTNSDGNSLHCLYRGTVAPDPAPP
jgi:WD40 repeat protein